MEKLEKKNNEKNKRIALTQSEYNMEKKLSVDSRSVKLDLLKRHPEFVGVAYVVSHSMQDGGVVSMKCAWKKILGENGSSKDC